MIAKRMVNVLLHPDFIYKRTQTYRKERHLIDIAESLSAKVQYQSISLPFTAHLK